MISHRQLIFSILQERPGLVHGRDFWVGQEMEGDVQSSDAKIYEWKGEDEPTEQELVDWLEKHSGAYIIECQTQNSLQEQSRLLSELDHAIMNPIRWMGFSSAEQAALATYRQALLDVPQQPGFPSDIDWPEAPVNLN